MASVTPPTAQDGKYIVTVLLNETAQVSNATSGQLLRIAPDLGTDDHRSGFQLHGQHLRDPEMPQEPVKIWDECPAGGDPALLVRLGKRQVVSQLTPLERLAKG